jgi:Ribbon-helix-helix domain
MKSLIVKRSVVVAGHKTSVSLEDAFWKGLKEVAGERDTTLTEQLARSILSGNTAICHPPFGFSCLTSIALSFPISRSGATDRMESLKAPAPCGLDGSRRHVTDRFRIATTTARRADASCAEAFSAAEVLRA